MLIQESGCFIPGILDGIDQLSDPPGFRIRSHDFYAPLPGTLIYDSGDRYSVPGRIQDEAAKLTAMVFDTSVSLHRVR